MPSRITPVFVLALLFSGCTHYYYYARSPNMDGANHEALAMWSVTERALWFDESSETVRVTMQCGKTVAFQQREGGVYLLYDPTDWNGPRDISGARYCGQVVGVTSLSELGVGQPLTVAVWCTHHDDDEGFAVTAPVLPSGTHSLGAVQRADIAPVPKECPITAPAPPNATP